MPNLVTGEAPQKVAALPAAKPAAAAKAAPKGVGTKASSSMESAAKTPAYDSDESCISITGFFTTVANATVKGVLWLPKTVISLVRSFVHFVFFCNKTKAPVLTEGEKKLAEVKAEIATVKSMSKEALVKKADSKIHTAIGQVQNAKANVLVRMVRWAKIPFTFGRNFEAIGKAAAKANPELVRIELLTALVKKESLIEAENKAKETKKK